MSAAERMKRRWAEKREEMLRALEAANARASERNRTRWENDPDGMAEIAARNAAKAAAAVRGTHFDQPRRERHSEALKGRTMGGGMAPKPSHVHARSYALEAPDGAIYSGRNLIDFVREHDSLFSPADVVWNKGHCRASKALSRLRPGTGGAKRWKGWRWATNVEAATADTVEADPSDSEMRDRLIAARKILGVTRPAMAGLLMTPRQTYSQWERGNRRVPGVAVVAAEALACAAMEDKEEGRCGK